MAQKINVTMHMYTMVNMDLYSLCREHTSTEPGRGHRWFFFLFRSLELLSRGILTRGNEILSRSLEIANSWERDSYLVPTN